jgi:hypothetical protein
VEWKFYRELIAWAQIANMRFTKYIITVIYCAVVSTAFSQIPYANPLLIHSNNPIAFDKVDAKITRQAVEQIIQL